MRTTGELHVSDNKTEISSSTGRLVANCGGYSLRDGTGKTKQENQANAEFIVQAVNLHDRLVEALRETQQYLAYHTRSVRASELLAKINAILADIGANHDR